MMDFRTGCGVALLAAMVAMPLAAQTPAPSVVYRCPGPPVLYTDALTSKEATERNCKTIEGTPITVIQPIKPRAPVAPASVARGEGSRVTAADQRTRDAESRRILEGELRREQERLDELRKEYNNGEPERQGNERNYQRYLDRVADIKAGIARKEGDIASIKRELDKLPQ